MDTKVEAEAEAVADTDADADADAPLLTSGISRRQDLSPLPSRREALDQHVRKREPLLAVPRAARYMKKLCALNR